MGCRSVAALLLLLAACSAAGEVEESHRVLVTLHDYSSRLAEGKALNLAKSSLNAQNVLSAAAAAYGKQQGCLSLTHNWDGLFSSYVEYDAAAFHITHGSKLLVKDICSAAWQGSTQAGGRASPAASSTHGNSTPHKDPGHTQHQHQQQQQPGASQSTSSPHVRQQQQQQRRHLPGPLLRAQQQQQGTAASQPHEMLLDPEGWAPELVPTPVHRTLLQEPASTQDMVPGSNRSGEAAERMSAEANLRSALMATHSKLFFPHEDYGKMNVTINMYFHKVLKVDLYAGTLRLAVWLAIRWKDPRLAWDPREHANITKLWFQQDEENQVEIWQPEIALWNAADRMQDTLDLRPMRSDYNGSVYWSRNGAIEVACNFKGLSAFPYGDISCDLELGSWHWPPTIVDVAPHDDKGYVIGGSLTSMVNAVHVEYNLHTVNAQRVTYPYYDCCPDDSNWPVVIYTVVLRRASVVYSLKILVPQIVLTWVAFSTFWLSPECGERLGLAVTIPLAVAVYDLLVFSSLPTSNRINFVSAMGLLGFLFCVMVLLENALVIQLYYYREAHYMRSWSLLKRTLLAYREQVVWVGVLQVLDQLKLDVAKRQMQRSRQGQGNTPWRQLSRHLSRSRSKGALQAAAAGINWGRSNSGSLHNSDPGSAAPTAAPAGGDRSDALTQLDRTDTARRVQPPAFAPVKNAAYATAGVDGMDAEAGAVPEEAPASPTAGSKATILQMQDTESLKAYLEDLMAPAAHTHSAAASAAAVARHGLRHWSMQRKLRRAVRVFTLDRLVERLQPYITGDAASTGRHAESAAFSEFREALATDYNVRWRLLSATIDFVARWVFTLGYGVAVLVVGITLTTDKRLE